uniref:Uncharacterized protein n=1 Tax=Helianthus annuus TaxID=4232 RepID=A0A251RNF3_HELAN
MCCLVVYHLVHFIHFGYHIIIGSLVPHYLWAELDVATHTRNQKLPPIRGQLRLIELRPCSTPQYRATCIHSYESLYLVCLLFEVVLCVVWLFITWCISYILDITSS